MARKETLKVSVTVQPDDWWEQRLADIRREGLRMARKYRSGGHHWHLENLSLPQVRGGDTVGLAVAKIDLNWKIATKIEMVKAARDIMGKSYTLGSLDPALQTILKSVIEEKGLYEHSIGEFFLLYGRFEQKYGVFKGTPSPKEDGGPYSRRKEIPQAIQGIWQGKPYTFTICRSEHLITRKEH